MSTYLGITKQGAGRPVPTNFRPPQLKAIQRHFISQTQLKCEIFSFIRDRAAGADNILRFPLVLSCPFKDDHHLHRLKRTCPETV